MRLPKRARGEIASADRQPVLDRGQGPVDETAGRLQPPLGSPLVGQAELRQRPPCGEDEGEREDRQQGDMPPAAERRGHLDQRQRQEYHQHRRRRPERRPGPLPKQSHPGELAPALEHGVETSSRGTPRRDRRAVEPGRHPLVLVKRLQPLTRPHHGEFATSHQYFRREGPGVVVRRHDPNIRARAAEGDQIVGNERRRVPPRRRGYRPIHRSGRRSPPPCSTGRRRAREPESRRARRHRGSAGSGRSSPHRR